MAGRWSTDRARVYEYLEDALAEQDVAHEALHAARAAVHKALAAAGYPHLKETGVVEKKEATLAAPSIA